MWGPCASQDYCKMDHPGWQWDAKQPWATWQILQCVLAQAVAAAPRVGRPVPARAPVAGPAGSGSGNLAPLSSSESAAAISLLALAPQTPRPRPRPRGPPARRWCRPPGSFRRAGAGSGDLPADAAHASEPVLAGAAAAPQPQPAGFVQAMQAAAGGVPAADLPLPPLAGACLIPIFRNMVYSVR